MKNKLIILILVFLLLPNCVGTGSKGVFGTGVSIALAPRSLGTQIDDSILQKNLLARLTLKEKNYLLLIKVKILPPYKFVPELDLLILRFVPVLYYFHAVPIWSFRNQPVYLQSRRSHLKVFRTSACLAKRRRPLLLL